MYLKNKIILTVFCLISIFFVFIALHLMGEGNLLVFLHCVLEGDGFRAKDMGTTSISCIEFHKLFPQYIGVNNVITESIPLDDGSGMYQKFAKIDKNILDPTNMTFRDRLAHSMASSEPKCARSLGSFIKSVLNSTK